MLAGENSPKGHVVFCDWTEFEANRGKHMENFSPFTSYQINIIILYFKSLSKKIIPLSFSFHVEELYGKLRPRVNIFGPVLPLHIYFYFSGLINPYYFEINY